MDTIKNHEIQELVDRHPITGKPVPWVKHKKNNLLLAESFRRLEKSDLLLKGRAAQLEDCGSWLEFRRYETGDLALNRANFCKYRLCPVCGFRRSLKNFGQASQVMDEAEKNHRFLFVTLTVRNCTGPALRETINLLYQGFTRLMRQGRYKSQVKGWMRNLEVTHNVDRKSKSFDTYHPHLHIILAVIPSYFTSGYISQKRLVQDWARAANLDYSPNVDIRSIPAKKSVGAIKEVSKYCTKASDILTDDNTLTDSGVLHLDKALSGRRLVSYGGVLKKIKADLNLDDPETGDLVNVDLNQFRDDLSYVLETYRWSFGYNQYFRKE